jgi:hypothetical protein
MTQTLLFRVRAIGAARALERVRAAWIKSLLGAWIESGLRNDLLRQSNLASR